MKIHRTRRISASKWYVEYKTYRGWQYINGVEAEDGKEAIEWVKQHVAIDAYKFKAFKEDEVEDEVD